ncbi:MAG: copper resistance protein NlpE N-terminal domain-containing protein [Flavobacteriaceae bacterium]|nr:copper resistance protein NlpE N-terminal domain-containing protein [Flavobacteriaceae bacterium]
MKKLLYILILTPLFLLSCKDSTKTTTNVKTDYLGTYQGVLPCASCPGIKTTIELYKDNTYTYDTEYLGENTELFTKKGTYTLLKNILSLQLDDEEILHLKINKNQLIYLGKDTLVNTGALASFYILKKESKKNN